MGRADDLDWDDLRYFLRAVHSRTLAGAARDMGVEHTTIGRRLSALVGISNIIGSERDLSKILTQGAALLGKVVDADNVFIFHLRGGKEGGDDFELLARHDRSEEVRSESVSRSIIRDCLEKGHAVLTADAGLDARFHTMASVVMKQIKSVICVPITGLGRNIGVLYLSNSHRIEAFTADDLELASAVAAQFGTTIQLRQMIHRPEQIFRNSIRTLVKAIEMRDPLSLGRAERRLRVAQRSLARKARGSHNRRKARVKVARCHAATARARANHLHQASARLVRDYDVIVVEKLNVKGLARGALAKDVHDASWAKFISMLRYKAEYAGSRLIEVDPDDTSQECSGCGMKVPKKLGDRLHDCSNCGLAIDRDLNAARNILDRAGVSPGLRNVAGCGMRAGGNLDETAELRQAAPRPN